MDEVTVLLKTFFGSTDHHDMAVATFQLDGGPFQATQIKVVVPVTAATSLAELQTTAAAALEKGLRSALESLKTYTKTG